MPASFDNNCAHNVYLNSKSGRFHNIPNLSMRRRSHCGRICRHLSTVQRDLCRQDIAICDCNLSQYSCFIQARDSDDTLLKMTTCMYSYTKLAGTDTKCGIPPSD